MALYRCAACGSPNVVTDTQTGGISYNYKKGIVGTVVLGAGGAAAGIQSKKEQVFKCPDCGIVLSYPMEQDIKNAIDLGVMSADARENLMLYGRIAVPWSYLTGKYKNIEKGIADEVLEMQALTDAKKAEFQAQTNRMIAETLMEMKQKTNAEIVIMEHENIGELQQAWELNSADTRSKREKAYNDRIAELDSSFSEKERALRLKCQNEITELEEQVAALKKKSAGLSDKLSTLGFFKMGEKKRITQQIDEIASQITTLDEKKNNVAAESPIIIKNLLEEKQSTLLAVKKEIDNTYPLTQSPVERNNQLDYFRKLHNDANDPTLTGTQKDNIFLKEMLCYALEFYDREVCYDDFDELTEVLNFVLEMHWGTTEEYHSGMSNQRLSALLRHLVEDGKVKRAEIKRKRYFALV